MKFVAVDCQGNDIPDLDIREFAIAHAYVTDCFLIKPSVPFKMLTAKAKRSVNYLSERVHGLSYDSGFETRTELKRIIKEKIVDERVQAVVVKGKTKELAVEKILRELEEEFGPHDVRVKNVEPMTACPKFKPVPRHDRCNFDHNCGSQNGGLAKCAAYNARKLMQYLCETILCVDDIEFVINTHIPSVTSPSSKRTDFHKKTHKQDQGDEYDY